MIPVFLSVFKEMSREMGEVVERKKMKKGKQTFLSLCCKRLEIGIEKKVTKRKKKRKKESTGKMKRWHYEQNLRQITKKGREKRSESQCLKP